MRPIYTNEEIQDMILEHELTRHENKELKDAIKRMFKAQNPKEFLEAQKELKHLIKL